MEGETPTLSYSLLVVIYNDKTTAIINNDKNLSFVVLLSKDGPAIIQTRSLQVLAAETFIVHMNMGAELIQGLFCVWQTHYNLENCNHFVLKAY